MNLIRADIHPEVLAAVLSEALVPEQSIVTGNPKDRGNPIRRREGVGIIRILVFHFHLHADCDLIPTVGHGSLSK